MVKDLWGRLFGDKGYISQALSALLQAAGLAACDEAQKEHEEPLHRAHGQAAVAHAGTHRDGQRPVEEHLADRARAPPEPLELLGSVAAGLIAYTWREKKPSLSIRVKEQFLMSN